MGKALEKYKSYIGWGQLFDAGLVAVIAYVLNFNLQGIVGLFLVIHFAGFLIYYFGLDGKEDNPMKNKAKDLAGGN